MRASSRSARVTQSPRRCTVSPASVDAFGGPAAITAQITRRPLRARREVTIERLRTGARGHRSVTQQRVHLRAAERQRDRQRALERDGVRVGANRGRHQHAGSTRSRVASRVPQRAIGGKRRAPVRIRAPAGEVPPAREAARPPQRRETPDDVLHARMGSTGFDGTWGPASAGPLPRADPSTPMRRRNSGGGGAGQHAPRVMRRQLSPEKPPVHGDRARTDRCRALDVVRCRQSRTRDRRHRRRHGAVPARRGTDDRAPPGPPQRAAWKILKQVVA